MMFDIHCFRKYSLGRSETPRSLGANAGGEHLRATIVAWIRLGYTTNFRSANADVSWNYTDWYIWRFVTLNSTSNFTLLYPSI